MSCRSCSFLKLYVWSTKHCLQFWALWKSYFDSFFLIIDWAVRSLMLAAVKVTRLSLVLALFSWLKFLAIPLRLWTSGTSPSTSASGLAKPVVAGTRGLLCWTWIIENWQGPSRLTLEIWAFLGNCRCATTAWVMKFQKKLAVWKDCNTCHCVITWLPVTFLPIYPVSVSSLALILVEIC